MARALFLQAQQISHLGHGDEEPGPGHETDDDRCGNVSRQVAQAEDGHEDLDSAGHYRQEKGRFDGLRRVGGHECQGAKDHQGNGVGRAVDQMRRRPENRGHRRDDNRRIKPVTRVDPGDQGIGHCLGHGDCRDGQAGDQVQSGVSPAVAAGRRSWLVGHRQNGC